MDLKQIVRAAVNRWRNKSFSPNETASKPTSTQRGITVSTETPATTVVTLTVSGTNEPPRVFTVTASSFSISYQGNKTFVNIQADTVTDVEARPAGDVPAKDVQHPALDAASEVPALPAKENTPARMNADIISFLNRTCELRFNVLTECTECRLNGEDAFHPLTERIRNMLCVQAQDAGISCWDRDLNRIIESARVPDYHPFRGYFAALPAWDGRDRLTDLAARVSTDEKWIRHFHRWMLGLAAQWAGFGDGMHAHSVAPLLVSDQQGMGKSTFCRALMPAELTAYYTDSVNLNQQDKLERHLIEMGLINLDEFDRIPASRQPQLKNTMQLSALSIRRVRRYPAHPHVSWQPIQDGGNQCITHSSTA